ncbi:MAG: hypothetical protein JSS99_10170 [Actinobacteria bacterium]|nr:hypothetical protein [Actinomycetota bacterium]
MAPRSAFCSMCGPKYCPMHNFREIDWDDVRWTVETRRAQRTAAGAGID